MLISHTDCSDYTYVIAVTNPEDDKDTRLSAFFVPSMLLVMSSFRCLT